MAEVGGHLRAVSLDPLDEELEAMMQSARALWSALGAKLLLLEGEKDHDSYWHRCRVAEQMAIDLSVWFDHLAKLSEKREAR